MVSVTPKSRPCRVQCFANRDPLPDDFWNGQELEILSMTHLSLISVQN
jgi:hypothetical protein